MLAREAAGCGGGYFDRKLVRREETRGEGGRADGWTALVVAVGLS